MPATAATVVADSTSGATPTHCARCATLFECGMGTGACWCASLPALAQIDGSATSCLCRSCLQDELARQRQ